MDSSIWPNVKIESDRLQLRLHPEAWVCTSCYAFCRMSISRNGRVSLTRKIRGTRANVSYRHADSESIEIEEEEASVGENSVHMGTESMALESQENHVRALMDESQVGNILKQLENKSVLIAVSSGKSVSPNYQSGHSRRNRSTSSANHQKEGADNHSSRNSIC